METEMKYIISGTIFGLMTLTSSLVLAEEDHCFKYYVETAKESRNIGLPLQYGGLGSTLGGTTAGVMGTASGGVVTVAIIGGSSVGSTGDSYVAEAAFASNIAQTMIEAKADVVGPYSSQMASDLNDAIYDNGKFKPEYKNGNIQYKSPLGDEVKRQLKNTLGGRKVSADDLSSATKFLIKTGGLCKVDGRILSQEDWASLIVSSGQ